MIAGRDWDSPWQTKVHGHATKNQLTFFKITQRYIIGPNNATPRYIRELKTYLHIKIYSSIFHNSPRVETTHFDVHQLMNE